MDFLDDYDDEDDYQRNVALLVVALACLARQCRTRRRYTAYLTRPALLPTPRSNTPWESLVSSYDDKVYPLYHYVESSNVTAVLINGG